MALEINEGLAKEGKCKIISEFDVLSLFIFLNAIIDFYSVALLDYFSYDS